MEHLTDKLKLLKRIVPDDDFTVATKFAIISSARPPLNSYFYTKFVLPKFWAGSVAMAGIALAVILISNIGPSNVATSVSELAALEQETVLFEKDINITLREIRAFNESSEKTAVVLREASLNQSPSAISNITTPEFSVPSANTNQEQVRYLLQQAAF